MRSLPLAGPRVGDTERPGAPEAEMGGRSPAAVVEQV